MKKHFISTAFVFVLLLCGSKTSMAIEVISNSNPIFTSTPITSIEEYTNYNYQISTTDTVTITATTLPSWLSLNNPPEVSTFAGSKSGNLDGTARNARFASPASVAVDKSRNVYVADAGNHRIRKIAYWGYVTTLAGSTAGFADGTGSAAMFSNPQGIAVDLSGNIYVADMMNNKIRKISPHGVVTTLAGSAQGYADGTGSGAMFSYPSDLAIDASGNIYVADGGNHKIRKINSQGLVTTVAGSTAGFVDGTGTEAMFNNPSGVAVDASGNIYVADTENNRIRKISPHGVVTTLAGSAQGYADGTGSGAMFSYPSDLAIDASGNIYVADMFNYIIRKINPTGNVSTLVGSTDGSADGTANVIKFSFPVSVAVDASNNVYVADRNIDKIIKITQEVFLTGASPVGGGTYPVVLHADNGKGGTADQSFSITVTGTSNIQDVSSYNNLLIYPNPTLNAIEIQLNTISDAKSIKIVNAQGNVVANIPINAEKIIHYSISDFVPGVYVVNVITADKTYSRKIIKI